MARVKTGKRRRQRHKKVLKMTKGQFGTRHRLFRRANEAMLKSLWYAIAIVERASAFCASCGSPESTQLRGVMARLTAV